MKEPLEWCATMHICMDEGEAEAEAEDEDDDVADGQSEIPPCH